MSAEAYEANSNHTGSSSGGAEYHDPGVLDFEKGADGKWRMRGSDIPSAGKGQEGQGGAVSPRDRWHAAVERDERQKREEEEEREKEIENIANTGRELASFVYTPEGQRRVEALVNGLTRVVESTISRPHMETVHTDYLRDPSAIERVQRINESRSQQWRERVRSRVNELVMGKPLSNIEQAVYLRLEFNVDERFASGSFLNEEERRQREVLLGILQRELDMVSAALLYQLHENEPAEQRSFPPIVDPNRLRFYRISIEQAQEAFAKGWEEVKARAQSGEV